MIRTQQQQQQQQWQEKFFCNNHPGTEAVVFCEECSAISGCSGYWCRECDKKMHEMFPAHKRTEPRPFEKKACKKHPNQNAEEIFCWETKTFHCPYCAWENKISGDNVPDAVDKVIRDSERNYQDLRNSLKTLSERKDKISFELNGEVNSKNLERQKQEAQSAIHSAFNQMRELLDQRE